MKPESSVVFFPCNDIEETVNYYTNVLGLSVYKRQKDTVWIDCGYGYIAFVEYADNRPMAQGQCISFNMASVDEVKAMYALLLSRGAMGLKSVPQKHPRFPVYSFFLTDPNGYMLEFQKVLE